MKEKAIGIFGYGYVGKHIKKLFENHHDVCVYDPKFQINPKEWVLDCEFIFICVPTPMKENGECDTSIVEEVLTEIYQKADGDRFVCIKSTVPPEFTKGYDGWDEGGIHVIFSPEYAGESTYWNSYKFHTDMKEMPYYIFGGLKDVCSVFVDLYMPVCGPEKEYVIVDPTVAEIAKYMENNFFSTKIIFCNEFKNICDTFGADYNIVRELFIKDPRINPMHTMVTEKRGFGGKCLPKDLRAMINATTDKGGFVPLLQIVNALNRTYELDREDKKE